ncbi:putative ribonuclease H-like domain-containing protein [Tanacetum coccineum]|uniref:Ribonuclease H-like domain-containing protein n=1 Tax=Tanacetum coccineum TaxID=301880 RepID=A0ABQ5CSX7_9ASTR
MDRNNVRPISVAINTKFLNCLQIEWQKAKKSAKSHDPLALMAHSHVSSSQSHANSSHSPQPYYVTHPSSVVSNDDDYQEELQGDSQKDRLISAMILLARAISQRFSNPTNNHLCTSSNTINQAVIQDGRVDIQTRNAGSGGNGNRNAVRFNKNQVLNAVNGNQEGVLRTETNGNKTNAQCYNCNERGHFARDCPKPRVRDVKYFREQMLLAMKDEVGSNLTNTENDFMLDQTYDDDEMKELTAAVQTSSSNRERMNHVTSKTIVCTSMDDQIDSSIIFDGPYVANNGSISSQHSRSFDRNNAILELASKLKCEIQKEKEHIDNLLKEKDKLQKEVYQVENEKLIIQHETKLKKQDFQEKENRYLDDILDLQEKLSSHDRIVYKMGQSIQTIHMLGKKPNKFYDQFLKIGLGYQNPERLKKAIEFYKTDVIPMSECLTKKLVDIQEELIKEVQEMKSVFESMEQKDKIILESKGMQAAMNQRIKILEHDFQRAEAHAVNIETISKSKRTKGL